MVMLDRLKLLAAALCVIVGVWAYYHFSETALVLRILMVVAGLGAAAAVGWLSEPGKQFYAFARDSIEEGKRVAWPTNKEALQTTGVVVALVIVMAIFLALVDGLLAWAMKFVMGT
jgi:preprotein translocase subunit SecE